MTSLPPHASVRTGVRGSDGGDGQDRSLRGIGDTSACRQRSGRQGNRAPAVYRVQGRSAEEYKRTGRPHRGLHDPDRLQPIAKAARARIVVPRTEPSRPEEMRRRDRGPDASQGSIALKEELRLLRSAFVDLVLLAELQTW